MGISQPEVACSVIPFAAKPRAAAYLNAFDRMEINRWREHARLSGYDRMVIHEREPGDYAEMGNFLSLYRAGEAWSRWVFARKGHALSVWCSVTGVDLGEFPTLAAAFQAVMPAEGGVLPAFTEAPYADVVTAFPHRLLRMAQG